MKQARSPTQACKTNPRAPSEGTTVAPLPDPCVVAVASTSWVVAWEGYSLDIVVVDVACTIVPVWAAEVRDATDVGWAEEYVVLLAAAGSVGLYVVVAAAKISLHELVRIASGSRLVVASEVQQPQRKQVSPFQIPVATDSTSEMTVMTSPSMTVSAPPGFVNSSSMTETASSPSEIMLSRISGARVGRDSMKEVTSWKPVWTSSQTSVASSVARFSKAPGMWPSRTEQTNWPACCSLFSSVSRRSLGMPLTKVDTLGLPDPKIDLRRSLQLLR
jgi:hypothetical protein